MAYYAFINDLNIVTDVIVGKNEDELVEGVSSWEEHYADVFGQRCKRTSYNTFANTHLNGGTPYRYNFAGIGFLFDESIGTDGAFIPPKPFNSWILNQETCQWESPSPKPVVEGKSYYWSEDDMLWREYV